MSDTSGVNDSFPTGFKCIYAYKNHGLKALIA